MIKLLFTILLGVLLAFFVGLGIEAFYPTEKYPEGPANAYETPYAKTLNPDGSQQLSSEQIAEQVATQKKYDADMKSFQAHRETHARNASAMVIAASIIFMILSLTILQKVASVFPDGFLLGAILTLIYGIIRGFESSDNKFRFMLVAIGLVVALVLGYLKFIRGKEGALR